MVFSLFSKVNALLQTAQLLGELVLSFLRYYHADGVRLSLKCSHHRTYC
jgi:hypothetical protein